MNAFQTELANIHSEDSEVRNPELQELSELQLTLVGGGNIIVTIG
jgi:hypothetical protein